MADLPEDEKKALFDYFQQTFFKDGSSEYAIFVCFRMGMMAHHGLENDDRLGGLSLPISFWHGDIDWTPQSASRRVVKNNLFCDTHSHFYKISNSGHHLYFDNPEEFAQTIIEDLSNVNELTEVHGRLVKE